MGFWLTHFAWPGGDVYGNLIADVLLALPVTGIVRRVWRRHLKHQAAKHHETHRLLRELHERVAAITPPEDQT